jgi:multidrug resistance protein
VRERRDRRGDDQRADDRPTPRRRRRPALGARPDPRCGDAGTGLIAVDSTIIATAVPSIVADIGGFAQFPWLFSIYLLAQAVSVPVYGKLADLFGRKPVILFGIGLFLVGSVLCGAAWSMGTLIGSRALQGLGAGAIAPVAITIVGDIYSTAERAKAQGYIASVWGIAAVVGPTLGGLLSEYASWRWIFFVNIPLCLLAAAMLARNFHEQVERGKPRIDYRGATLLTAGLALVILAVLEGGQAWAWDSPASIAVFLAGAVLLAAFWVVERRAPEPVLPLWVFRRRLLVASSSSRPGSARSCSVSPRTCRRTCRRCSGTGRWSPGSRWPRCRWVGRSRRPRPARSTCTSASATAR